MGIIIIELFRSSPQFEATTLNADFGSELTVTPYSSAEELLWYSSLSMLESLFGAGNVALAHFDTEFRFVRVNNYLAQLNRMSVEEHVGCTPEQVIGPELWQLHRPFFQRALDGEYTSNIPLPTMLDPISGRVQFHEASIHPVHPGRSGVGIALIIKNVTKQILADITLRQRSAAFENMWDAVAITDISGHIVGCNDAFHGLFGYSQEEAQGQSIAMLLGSEESEITFDTVVTTIEHDGRWTGTIQFSRTDGNSGIVQTSVVPMRDDEDNLSGFVCVNRDITDQKANQAELASAFERETLINEIGSAIRDCATEEEMLQTVVKMLGKALNCDLAYNVRYQRDQNIATITHEWVGEGTPNLVGTYSITDCDANEDPTYLSGEVQSFTNNDTDNVSHQHLLTQLRLHSVLSVPLRTGQTMTALAVGMRDSIRDWTPNEKQLLKAVASQAVASMDAMRVKEKEHRIASVLQEALQPIILGSVTGLHLGSFMRPALDEARIGGDFFDVFEISTDRFAMVIGDVSGKGLNAAAQVSTVRNSLRTLLYQGLYPAQAVSALNLIMVQHNLLQGFVTLWVGLYNPAEPAILYCSAGHEPALMQSLNSTPQALYPTGPPVGIDLNATYENGEVPFSINDALLLYTDGISEAGPDRNNLLGTDGLGELFTSTRGTEDVQLAVQTIVESARERSNGSFRDDACIVMARRISEPDKVMSPGADTVLPLTDRGPTVRDQAERLGLIADNAPVLMSYFDSDGIFQYVNHAYADWFGRPQIDFIGEHLSNVLGVAAFQSIRAHVDRALSGTRVSYETTMEYSDSHVRYVHTDLVPDSTADGTVRGCVAIVTDISERREIELKLMESEQRFRSLFDQNVDAVYAFDLSGNFTLANDACETLSGYAPSELIGRPFPPLLVAEDLARVSEIFQRATAGVPQQYQTSMVKKTGETVQINVTNTPIVVSGTVVGVYGIAKNVSDQFAAIEALRQSKIVTTAMLEAALDSVITMDHEERVVEWNPAAERTFGFSREQAIGELLSSLIIPPSLRTAHKRGIAHYFATGEGPVLNRRVEVTAIRSDGTEFPAELTAIPVQLGDRTLFTAFVRDLTDRERAATQQRVFLQDVLMSVTEGKLRLCYTIDELPPMLPISTGNVSLADASGIRPVREAARSLAAAFSFDEQRIYDLMTGVSEAAMNAVVHAGGGTARVHGAKNTVQVWVQDHGSGIDVARLPRAALEKGYTTAGTLGHGMKMVLQTIDRIWILTGTTGTTLVLEQDLVVPLPQWLTAAPGI